jgi:hypothetical protein
MDNCLAASRATTSIPNGDLLPSRAKALDDIGTSLLQHEPKITANEKAHAATATMYDPVDIKNYANGG